MNAEIESPELLSALKRYFGFESFREGQSAIVSAILCGNDCVGVLPTGGGKSLCFQLPALLRTGLTLVVSPLIALMRDQVEALSAKRIQATCIHSSLGWLEMRDRLDRIARGQVQLLYVAPERFKNERFLAALSRVQVSLFAVDEAHCISFWGHDFRPDYLQLRQVIATLGDPQVAALTATATSEVRADIVKQLGLGQSPRDKPTVIVSGFARPNLTLAVNRVQSHADKLRRALAILADHPSGIIYCATRGNVVKVSEKLKQSGIACISYHGGMGDEERKQAEACFLTGRGSVAVATNAFGMGIDRPDLRSVIHWDVPGSLEAYYQEAGRAGRDGLPAHCEILFNYADLRTQEFFIEGANPSGELLTNVARSVAALCRKNPVTIDPKLLALQIGGETNELAVRTSLGLLDQAGMVSRSTDPRSGQTLVSMKNPEPDLAGMFTGLGDKERRDRARLKRMLRYIDSRSCRHAFLLNYFGAPAGAGECSQCDNCLRKTGPPASDRRPPTEEEWIEIQKVLSCIYRLRGRFGRTRIAEVLTGSDSDSIASAGLQHLPTFGAIAGCPMHYVRGLIDALLDAECLQVLGDEYPTLRLSPRGQKVMLRQESIMLSFPPRSRQPKPRRRRERPAPTVHAEASSETVTVGQEPLLDQRMAALRTLRTKLARERRIAPFLILSNTTLEGIARVAPRNRDELLAVKGIGPAKLTDLGDAILGAIRDTDHAQARVSKECPPS